MAVGAFDPLADVPLVGRDRELDLALRAAERAAGGRCTVVAVTGEAGAGKTRLLQAVRARLGERFAVGEGFAIQDVGAWPSFPLARAIESLSRSRDAGPEAREYRAALDAGGFFGAPRANGPSGRGDHEENRVQMAETLAGLVSLFAASGPVALLLDDMHWAQPRGWELLAHAVRRSAQEPLLVVVATRNEATSTDRGPIAGLAELSRSGPVIRIPLEALTEDDIAAIAGAYLNGEAGPGLRRWLAARCGGSPFFVEALLADLDRADRLEQAGGRWEVGAGGEDLEGFALPIAVETRLRALPGGAGEVLDLAAAIGRRFGEADLAACGIAADRVVASLEAAWAAGLVQRDGPGTWGFRHDILRDAIIARLGPRSRAMHRTVAQAFEARTTRYAGHIELADLADHWARAGEPVRAVEAAVRASAAASAADEAGVALALAHSAWVRAADLGVAPADMRLRWESAVRLGDAAVEVGGHDEAEAALRGGVRAAELLGDSGLLGAVWRRLGTLYRRREQPETAVGYLNRALELLGDGDSAEAAQAWLDLAGIEGLTRARYDEAELAAARATGMAERVGAGGIAARAMLAQADSVVRHHGPVAARVALERALEGALAADDLALAAEVAASLSNSHYWTGELRAARRFGELRADIALRSHQLFGLRHAHSWLALVAATGGHWSEARALTTQARPLLSRLESPEPVAFIEIVESFVHLRLGEAEAAAALASEAMRALKSIGDGTAVWYAGIEILACLEADRTAEALTLIAEQERRLESIAPDALPARSGQAALAYAFVALEDRPKAARCEELLRPFAGDFHWSPVRRALAALAALRGDRAAALADLEVAIAQSRLEGHQPDLALALAQRVELTGEARDREEAEALFESLGMPVPPGVKRNRASAEVPGRLTAREAEIIRHVAAGRTNREIAEALVISERTVINHLSNIFAKIGVDNRAGATAWAIRNGLA